MSSHSSRAHALLEPGEARSLVLADSVQVSSAGIVSRTVLQTPDVRVVLFAFDEGQELTAHTNRRRALIQILSGTCEFLFNGEWQKLPAGSFLHLPPNHPHAVRAGEEAFTMLLTLGSEPADLIENPSTMEGLDKKDEK